MTNLKVVALVIGLLAFYTLLANAIPQVQSEVPQELSFTGSVSAEELVAAGDQLYQGAGGCTACHGLGTRAPNLLADEAGTGLPVSDLSTNLAADPPTNNGAGLNPSPPGTLNQDTAGYVDYLDARGQWVGTGTAPAPGAVYIRRWSIEPLATNPNNTLVFQVLVTSVRRESELSGAAGLAVQRQRLPDDALVVSVKTRKAR